MDALEQFFERTVEDAKMDEFFKDTYEARRRFFRLASYGCYSRKDLSRLLLRQIRTYQYFVTFCEAIFPKDRYQPTQYKRNRRPAFRGDSYHGNENFLADTYRLKGLTQPEVFFFIHLLRVLGTRHSKDAIYTAVPHLDNKLLNNDLNNDSEYPSSAYAMYSLKQKGLEERTIHSYLRKLSAYGLVQIDDKKKPHLYALASDPFADLSADEAKSLLFAVDYFKNSAFLNVPGYFLVDTLCCKFNINKNRCQPFHFINLDIRRILDDDVVYQILLAIARGKYLHLVWHRNENEGFKNIELTDVHPLEIREDEQGDGRRQLIAIFTYKSDKPSRHLLRIEEISHLRLVDPPVSTPPYRKERFRKTDIHLRFLFHTADEKHIVIQRLRAELPKIIVHEDTDDPVLCSFSCRDPKKYLPLLRTFLPYIEILPSTKTRLHTDMRCGIEQTIQLYDGHPNMVDAEAESEEPQEPTDANNKQKPKSSMDTLFQEVHAGTYRWLIDRHNRLCDMAKREQEMPTMQKLLRDAPYYRIEHEHLFCQYIMAAFHFEITAAASDKIKENAAHKLTPKDLIVVPPKNKIPILPTTLELRWLKTCLLTQEADLFLSKALKEKLLSALVDIAPFDLSCWKRQPIWHPLDQRPSEIHTALTTVIYALQTHQGISFQTKNYVPLFLRQNASNGIYSLLLWDAQAHEPHIVSEEQLPLCIPAAMPYEDFQAARQAWQTYLSENGRTTDDKKRNFVTIAFHDSRNARERTYTLFSAFDKKAFIERDGSYHLTIYFCTFEQEDVLRRILSLGPYARVLEPTSVRDEIVRRLRKAQELYQREYGDPPQELYQ